MKSKPTISVIVLTRNQETTVGRAIESVIAAASDCNVEIIIGEDCSDDNTLAVCRRYAAQYPKIIRLMPPAQRKGIVRNYFDCLREARGEYITDCAGDDYWLPRRNLANEVDILRQNPGVSMVYGSYGYNTPTDNPGSAELLKRQLTTIGKLPIFLSAVTYRRADALRLIAERPGLIENPEFGCEDLPLICALLSVGNTYYIGEQTVYYSTDSGVTQSRDADVKIQFMETSMGMRLRLADFYGIDRRELLPYCRNAIRYAAAKSRRASKKSLEIVDKMIAEAPRGSVTLPARLHLLLARLR